MTGRYADGTSVQPETSQQEISGLLRRYGADGFAYGWEADKAMVTFRAHDRTVRFVLVLPTDWRKFIETPAGKRRTEPAARAALEAEVRRLWRCLCLAIKAKLEVVESGIATFEDEFLAHILLPDGSTVGDRVRPEIASAYVVDAASLRDARGFKTETLHADTILDVRNRETGRSVNGARRRAARGEPAKKPAT